MAMRRTCGMFLLAALLVAGLWQTGASAAKADAEAQDAKTEERNTETEERKAETENQAHTSIGSPVFSLAESVKGSRVTIEVTGNPLTDLYAYQFNLQYDPEQVRFIKASSPISGFTVNPAAKDGSILFAHSKVGKVKGTNGEAVLAAFTFEPLKTGRAEFALRDIKLVDSALNMAGFEAEVTWTTALAGFTDIAGHWAEASILKASGQGWVSGYGDGTFKPQRQVTRAEFVTMLARAMELTIPAAPAVSFADREEIPAWSLGYIQAAVEAGLVEGYGDGTFRAGKLITRAETAAMIVRAQGIVPATGGKPGFADTVDIPLWAQPYIAVAEARGWVKGVGEGTFAPLRNATRAESVHMIAGLREGDSD